MSDEYANDIAGHHRQFDWLYALALPYERLLLDAMFFLHEALTLGVNTRRGELTVDERKAAELGINSIELKFMDLCGILRSTVLWGRLTELQHGAIDRDLLRIHFDPGED